MTSSPWRLQLDSIEKRKRPFSDVQTGVLRNEIKETRRAGRRFDVDLSIEGVRKFASRWTLELDSIEKRKRPFSDVQIELLKDKMKINRKTARLSIQQ